MAKDLVEGLSFAETVVSQANSVIVIVDQHGRVQRFNKLSEEYTGKREQDIVGRSVFDMFMTREEASASRRNIAAFYRNGQSYEVERLINTVKGPRLFLFRNKFVTSGSGEKRVYLICSGTDITEERQAQERLRVLANTDVLTNLPNRHAITAQLQAALGGRGRRGGVLFLTWTTSSASTTTTAMASATSCSRRWRWPFPAAWPKDRRWRGWAATSSSCCRRAPKSTSWGDLATHHRAAARAVPPGADRGLHQLLDRHRHVSRTWRRPGQRGAQRRHRHVRGQGIGAPHLSRVPARDGPPQRRLRVAGHQSAQGHGRRPPDAALPACCPAAPASWTGSRPCCAGSRPSAAWSAPAPSFPTPRIRG